jgi:hypothetical protein
MAAAAEEGRPSPLGLTGEGKRKREAKGGEVHGAQRLNEQQRCSTGHRMDSGVSVGK